MFPSPKIASGFHDGSTDCDPVCLFNRRPQSRGLRCHPLVPIYSLVSEPFSGLRLVRSRRAQITPHKPPASAVGYLTLSTSNHGV
jgi:hypothetical protein